VKLLNSIFGTKKLENGFCDLHIHTTFSDGLLSPEQVIEKAKERGLAAVGIVDHDAVGGIEPAIKKGKELNVEVVPAVELPARPLAVAVDGKELPLPVGRVFEGQRGVALRRDERRLQVRAISRQRHGRPITFGHFDQVPGIVVKQIRPDRPAVPRIGQRQPG